MHSGNMFSDYLLTSSVRVLNRFGLYLRLGILY